MARRLNRRQFTLGGLAVLGGAGFGYGFGVEPRWPEVRTVSVTLARPLPAPVRILHLSDFHRSSFVSLSLLEEAIRLGLGHAPDLVCLTGDFVTSGDPEGLDGYVEVLRLLPSRAPTLAVLGNHDGGNWSRAHGGEATVQRVSELLESAGIEVLHNRSSILETEGGPFRLVGAGDLWSGECDSVAAFEGPSQVTAAATILLAHNPDTKDLTTDLDWDLMLSGHTHGGQVVVPLLGPPLVPVRDRRYTAGLNLWQGRPIYTTRGVGSVYGLRLNCRPEVTVLNVA